MADFQRAKARERGGPKKSLGLQTERRRENQKAGRKTGRAARLEGKRRSAPASGSEEVTPEAASAAAAAAVTTILSPPDAASLLGALRTLRGALSHPTEPPTADVVASGVVGAMTELLATPNDELQLEALACLTNIAADYSEHAVSVLDALPHLVSLVADPREALAEQAVWTLGNLAADSDELRAAVLAAGGLRPIAALLATAPDGSAGAGVRPPHILRTAAWALSNLARGAPGPAGTVAPFFDLGLSPVLLQLLAHADESVAAEAAWVLSFLSARDDQAATALAEAGAVGALSQALHRTQAKNPVATPALRTLGNFASIGENFAAAIVAEPLFLPPLVHLYSAEAETPKGLLKEATWLVSNLAVGQREAVVGAGLLPPLVQIVASAQFDLQREALFALRNLMAEPAYATSALEQGVLAPVVSFLRTQDPDAVMCALAVCGLVLQHQPDGPQAVEAAGGMEAIDDLNYSGGNGEVKAFAAHLVDTYYGDDYGEDEVEAEAGAGDAGGGLGGGFGGGPGVAPPAGGFSFGQAAQLGGGAESAGPAPGAGRGRGMTLPSWMTQQPGPGS